MIVSQFSQCLLRIGVFAVLAVCDDVQDQATSFGFARCWPCEPVLMSGSDRDSKRDCVRVCGKTGIARSLQEALSNPSDEHQHQSRRTLSTAVLKLFPCVFDSEMPIVPHTFLASLDPSNSERPVVRRLPDYFCCGVDSLRDGDIPDSGTIGDLTSPAWDRIHYRSLCIS
jgi:hypothetical protein